MEAGRFGMRFAQGSPLGRRRHPWRGGGAWGTVRHSGRVHRSGIKCTAVPRPVGASDGDAGNRPNGRATPTTARTRPTFFDPVGARHAYCDRPVEDRLAHCLEYFERNTLAKARQLGPMPPALCTISAVLCAADTPKPGAARGEAAGLVTLNQI
jgi:hypothetical protein